MTIDVPMTKNAHAHPSSPPPRRHHRRPKANRATIRTVAFALLLVSLALHWTSFRRSSLVFHEDIDRGDRGLPTSAAQRQQQQRPSAPVAAVSSSSSSSSSSSRRMDVTKEEESYARKFHSQEKTDEEESESALIEEVTSIMDRIQTFKQQWRAQAEEGEFSHAAASPPAAEPPLPPPVRGGYAKDEVIIDAVEGTKEKADEKDEEESFSACLLLRDDNDRLIEWIAYHYTVLPLRHLVVAVDPRSVFDSPTKIADRWNRHAHDLGLRITVWNDDDYIPFDRISFAFGSKGRHDNTTSAAENVAADAARDHANRKAWFTSKCTAYHKFYNRTWTTHIDVDEYIVFNSIQKDDPGPTVEVLQTGLEEHGDSGSRTVVNLTGHADDIEDAMEGITREVPRIQWIEARARLPPDGLSNGNVTILSFLRDEERRLDVEEYNWAKRECHVLPRLFVSSVEGGREEVEGSKEDGDGGAGRRAAAADSAAATAKALGIPPTNFTTLRYTHHAPKGRSFHYTPTGRDYNRMGKSIVDASRIPNVLLDKRSPSPSIPFRLCRPRDAKGYGQASLERYYDAVFRVQHYLGSKGMYLSRRDERKSTTEYEAKWNVSYGVTYDVYPWLNRFVEAVGSVELSRELLEGVGRITNDVFVGDKRVGGKGSGGGDGEGEARVGATIGKNTTTTAVENEEEAKGSKDGGSSVLDGGVDGRSSRDNNHNSGGRAEAEAPDGVNMGSDSVSNNPEKQQPRNSTPRKKIPPTASTTAANKSSSLSHLDESFSGCLLIKDDNDRLIEWIAYHWTILPLRHLVIAVDPTSRTSPASIADRWNAHRDVLGLDIVLWHNDTFIPANKVAPMSSNDTVKIHRYRQAWFISKCSLYHKKRNRTWTAHWDTDEYVVFNGIRGDDPGPHVEVVRRKGLSPDGDVGGARGNDVSGVGATGVKLTGDAYDLEDAEGSTRDIPRISWIEARARLPKDGVGGNATILSFLREEEGRLDADPAEEHNWAKRICHVMPRLFFSSREDDATRHVVSPGDESIGATLGIPAANFSTLRFVHHAEKGAKDHNRNGKSIVDVSRMPLGYLNRKSPSPHVPFKQCWASDQVYGSPPVERYYDAVFRVQHYLGSWEQYDSRSDRRRSREAFDRKGLISNGTSFEIYPWLERFVREVGSVELSRELLKGVGRVSFRMEKQS